MVIVYDKKSILEGVNFFSFFSLGETLKAPCKIYGNCAQFQNKEHNSHNERCDANSELYIVSRLLKSTRFIWNRSSASTFATKLGRWNMFCPLSEDGWDKTKRYNYSWHISAYFSSWTWYWYLAFRASLLGISYIQRLLRRNQCTPNCQVMLQSAWKNWWIQTI